MTLHLIRSLTEPVSEYYYDFKTDVWLYGDHEGYASLIGDLQRASALNEPVHVSAIPDDSPGMRCVILPTVKSPNNRAAVRIVERIAFWQSIPKMQMMLRGNKMGITKLISIIQDAMLATGGPLDHIHCDDEIDSWLVKRSISLNLRGPITDWSSNEFECYWEDIRRGGTHLLPASLDWLEYSPEYSYDYLHPDMCLLE